MTKHTHSSHSGIELEKENKELKEDNELNKGMIQFLNEKIEILEKQLDRRD